MLHGQEHPGEAEVDDLLPGVERVVDDRAEGSLPGVGDGQVQPTVLDGELGECLDLGLVGDVAVRRDHSVAVGVGQCREAPGVDVAGDDDGAVADEAIGDGAADPRSCSGDEGDLAVQGCAHVGRR